MSVDQAGGEAVKVERAELIDWAGGVEEGVVLAEEFLAEATAAGMPAIVEGLRSRTSQKA